MKKKAIDLFCGGGGGDHGIESIGFQSIIGLDISEKAIKIRRHAFPHSQSVVADFFQIKDQTFDFKDASLAIVGFPCTTFSTSGKREGIPEDLSEMLDSEEVRQLEGRLAMEFPAFLSRHKIPFLLGENVTGLLSSGKVYGLDYLKILAELDRQGYYGCAGVIDSRHYVPQMRKRIYVLAIHKSFLERIDEIIEVNKIPASIRIHASWLYGGTLSNLANHFWKRKSGFDSQSIRTINLAKWRESWEDFGGVEKNQLKFVSWFEGKLVSCNADFAGDPYCSQTVRDCLLEDGIAFKYRSSKGDKIYTKVFPTIRGLNQDAGSGALKVVTAQGDRRPHPCEIEKAMGWPVGSTDAPGVKYTSQLKVLSKGMVPGAIADMGSVFSGLIGYKSPLKWAGGKAWFADEFREIWKHHCHRRYFDPCCGGLSLFFAVQPSRAYLADVNNRLINFWQHCAKGFQVQMDFINTENHYYSLRENFNRKDLSEDPQWFAEAFYYINRVGRSGLCRTNSSGEINTPYGWYSDAELQRQVKTDFREYIPIFKGASISRASFEDSLRHLQPEDFLLVDPPYFKTFTDYSGKFEWSHQVEIAQLAAFHRGPVICFNSYHPETVELYSSLGFSWKTREAPRRITHHTEKRPPAIELIAFKNLES